MSRSHKKYCGSSFVCYRSDKPWRKQWHSAMRAKERDLFRLQMKFPENDYCYPIPREVDNIYSAPSDGGSQWMYSSFEDYFYEQTRPRHYRWGSWDIPTREEARREWKKNLVGK